MDDVRIVLLGAKGAGKSALLAEIARAAGVTPALDASGATGIQTVSARRRYVLLDAPEANVPDVIASGVHGAVLVVSAADSLLPASLSHVEAARERGVPVVAVYLSMAPQLDVELADLVQMEIEEMVARYVEGRTVPVVRSIAAAPRTAHGEPTAWSGIGQLASVLDAWLPGG